MKQVPIAVQARLLLARRNDTNDMWYYLRRDLRRQTVVVLGYAFVAIGLWCLGWRMTSMAAAGFFMGSKVRDLRWWAALSGQWDSTADLLDWPRIEELAKSAVESAASPSEASEEGDSSVG